MRTMSSPAPKPWQQLYAQTSPQRTLNTPVPLHPFPSSPQAQIYTGTSPYSHVQTLITLTFLTTLFGLRPQLKYTQKWRDSCET